MVYYPRWYIINDKRRRRETKINGEKGGGMNIKKKRRTEDIMKR
tara:strand:- start:36 stop:167 length:132 start_codon:yes stop_codon:yes gene_type:complete